MAQITPGEMDQAMMRNTILSMDPNAQLPSYLTEGDYQNALDEATLASTNPTTNSLIGSQAAGGAGGAYGNVSPQLLSETQTSLGTALKGQLPSDVQNLLRQSAAQYGVAAGLPGSQFAGYRGLRNLGLTSLDQTNRAQNALTPFLTSPADAQKLALDRASLSIDQQNQAMQMRERNEMVRQQRAAERRQQSQDWTASRSGYSPYGSSVTYGYQPTGSYGGGGGGYQQSSYGAPSWQPPSYAAPSYQPYTWYGGTANEPLSYGGAYAEDTGGGGDYYADSGDWGDAYYDWDYSS